MFRQNPIFNLDSYKLGHVNMYPSGTTEIYSNFTPRSNKRFNAPEQFKSNQIVWFGGQAAVKKIVDLFKEEFFSKPFNSDEFKRIVGPFAGDYDTSKIEALHELGYLPLEIRTLPEGRWVNIGVPVLTIRNTKFEYAWLTNWLETWLSNEIWHMATSATTAATYRKIGEYWYNKTGANLGFLDFAFHDFSLRGQTTMESGMASGAAHLTSFTGSDSVPSVPWIEYYYGAMSSTLIAASVPASEHSVQTAYVENDYEYIKHIITEVYPTGIVSLVVDGYDYWNVITNIVPRLKEEILSRKPDALGFAKVVFRPDSGDPVKIIGGYKCGYYSSLRDAKKDIHKVISAGYEIVFVDDKYYSVNIIEEETFDGIEQDLYFKYTELTEAEVKGSIECLYETFGGTMNEKGYITLNPKVGLIYGDSITMERADQIFELLAYKGFASDNIVLGIGSYTYQYVTRDTLGFAMKATNAVINGVDIPLFKDPKTDDGTKRSAKGLLMVIEEEGQYLLVNNVTREQEHSDENQLTVLFKDGNYFKHQSFDDVRGGLRLAT